MPIQGPNQTNDMHWLDYTYTGLVMQDEVKNGMLYFLS